MVGKRTSGPPLSTAQNRSTIMAKLYSLYPAVLGQIGSEGGEGRREWGEEGRRVERRGEETREEEKGEEGKGRREEKMGAKERIASHNPGNISTHTNIHTHTPILMGWCSISSSPSPNNISHEQLTSGRYTHLNEYNSIAHGHVKNKVVLIGSFWCSNYYGVTCSSKDALSLERYDLWGYGVMPYL